MDINRIYFNLTNLYRLIPYYLFPAKAFPPLHVFFETTFRCNLRCSMCQFLDIIEQTEKLDKKEELSFEEIKQVIMQVPRYSVITFTGGEPFMRKDILDILRFATLKNKCHIITNGTLINEKIAESLVAMRSKNVLGKGLFAIGISLEGKKETNDKIVEKEGSFEKTTKAIELIQEYKAKNKAKYPLCHLTMVLSHKNVNDIADIYRLAESFKIDVCNLILENTSEYSHSKNFDKVNNLDSPPGPVKKIDPTLLKFQLDQIMSLSKQFRTKLRFSPPNIKPPQIIRYYDGGLDIKDFRCYVPWTKTGVTVYGSINSCPHYYMGNIRENGNSISWNGEKYNMFRKKLRQRKIFPRCMGCCQSEYIKK